MILISSALSLPGQLFAQKNFQGIVTFKFDARGNAPNTFTYYLKGDKARMEMQMPGQAQMMGKAAFIIDAGKREMITLIPQMKMYMQMSMPPMDSTGYSGNADDGEKPVKVGDTEVILGHKCDHWKINDENGGTVDLWNAKGFGNFMMPGMGGMPGGGRQPQWMKDMMSQGFFPLKVVVTKKDGTTDMSMVATKIEKKDLSTSLFEIPSGYNKMNIPNMGNMGQQN